MEASRIKYAMLCVLPLTVMACTLGTPRKADRLCEELAVFASSAVTEVSPPVVLRGGWGGGPDTLMTHDCTHHNSDSGKTLCAYLLPNSSWEFGSGNAINVAACMDSSDRFGFIKKVENDEWPAEISSPLRLLSDKSISLSARIAADGRGLSILTLSAARSTRIKPRQQDHVAR